MDIVKVEIGLVKMALGWQECALIARGLRCLESGDEYVMRQVYALTPAFEAIAALGFAQINVPAQFMRDVAFVAGGVAEQEVL